MQTLLRMACSVHAYVMQQAHEHNIMKYTRSVVQFATILIPNIALPICIHDPLDRISDYLKPWYYRLWSKHAAARGLLQPVGHAQCLPTSRHLHTSRPHAPKQRFLNWSCMHELAQRALLSCLRRMQALQYFA